MRCFMTLILVFTLAVPSFGCGRGPNDWTEGDRQVLNQSLQGVQLTLGRLESFHALVADHPTAAEALEVIKSDLVTVEINLAATEKLHRAPEKKEKFSSTASEAARTQQAQEHSGRGLLGWITLIGGYLAGAVGLAMTVLNLPVVGPFLATTKVGQVVARVLSGPIVKMGLDGIKTISTLRSEAEEKPLTPQRVVELAKRTFSPSTAAIADKVSNQIETASGIVVTPIRQLEAPAV